MRWVTEMPRLLLWVAYLGTLAWLVAQAAGWLLGPLG